MNALMASEASRIDVGRDRYPYCIVWTPIPLITFVNEPVCELDDDGVGGPAILIQYFLLLNCIVALVLI